MLHPSTKRLIDKLDEMTRKQRVSWEESENDSVKHDTEGYRVTVTAAPHSLLLTDTQGREIETCTPDDFSGETDANGRPYSEFIEDLYREAHRHARGAEKAISALLSSLDEAEAEDGAEPETDEALATQESFEHPEDQGDESFPLEDHELPEPEYEGQAEMQAAIATMADQMSGVPEAVTEISEPAELEAAPEPEQEPVVEPPAMPAFSATPEEAPEPEPEPELEPEPEAAPVAAAPAEPEPEPYAPFAGSEDTARAYAVAAEFAPPAEAAPEPEAAPEAQADTPAEPEPFSDETHVWESIRNAGEPAEAEAAEPAAEPAPEPEAEAEPEPVIETAPVEEAEPPAQQPAAPVSRAGPVFGSGMFSDLSRYRTQQPAPEPEPEAAPEVEPEIEAEAAPEPEAESVAEATPEPAIETAPAPEPEPEPEPAPAPPPEPAPQRSFSLSGITSGFGLGSTHSQHRTQTDSPAAPAEPTERKIIDGTVDLPETLPEAETDATGPEAEWRMEQDDEFGFTAEDLMPGVPAEPLPAATETAQEAPASEPQPEEAKADKESAQPARPSRRFNPWN